MSSLILHPEINNLRTHVEQLRTELAAILDTQVRLNFEEIPALRYRYTELFGTLEREIEERTLEMSERRRMVELFALKLDRGQKLDMKTIDLVLKVVYNEFNEVRRRVERTARTETKKAAGNGWWNPRTEASQAAHPSANIPKTDPREARIMYMRLAKRLHPDRNGKRDALASTYWDLAQRGYDRGDLQLLRTLSNIITSVGEHYNGSSLEVLQNEEQRIRQAIATERTRIADICSTEPYVIRKELESEKWIAERLARLRKELDGIEREVEKCDRFLAPILTGRREHISPTIVKNIWDNFVENIYINNR